MLAKNPWYLSLVHNIFSPALNKNNWERSHSKKKARNKSCYLQFTIFFYKKKSLKERKIGMVWKMETIRTVFFIPIVPLANENECGNIVYKKCYCNGQIENRAIFKITRHVICFYCPLLYNIDPYWTIMYLVNTFILSRQSSQQKFDMDVDIDIKVSLPKRFFSSFYIICMKCVRVEQQNLARSNISQPNSSDF